MCIRDSFDGAHDVEAVLFQALEIVWRCARLEGHGADDADAAIDQVADRRVKLVIALDVYKRQD